MVWVLSALTSLNAVLAILPSLLLVVNGYTVKILNIWIPEKIAVIILKFEQCGFYHRVMCPILSSGAV